jgi:hypothetical protein
VQHAIENVVIHNDITEASDHGAQNYVIGGLFAFAGNLFVHFSGFGIKDERNFIAVFYPIEAEFVLRWNIHGVPLYESPNGEWGRNVCAQPRSSKWYSDWIEFCAAMGCRLKRIGGNLHRIALPCRDGVQGFGEDVDTSRRFQRIIYARTG